MVRSAAALPYGKFLVENAKSPTLCIAILNEITFYLENGMR